MVGLVVQHAGYQGYFAAGQVVCQIHGQALIRLRARMENWLAD